MCFKEYFRSGQRHLSRHLYFEFHVDKAMWQKASKLTVVDDRGQTGMAPEWPESPDLNDMGQGLSENYRQWRIDYHLQVDTVEAIDPVPHVRMIIRLESTNDNKSNKISWRLTSMKKWFKMLQPSSGF
ncbi:hypothetical protein ACKRZS_003350 [Fusarium odoratissimum]